MSEQENLAPELSRPFDLEHLSSDPQTRAFEADAGERAALAARLGVEAVEALSAELTVTGRAGRSAWVKGRVEADLIRLCVVTLEPISEHVEDTFDLAFEANAEAYAPGAEVEIEADEPEPLDETFDLGEIATQQVALAMEPYPRAENAPAPLGSGPAEGPANPFAALEALKSKPKT